MASEGSGGVGYRRRSDARWPWEKGAVLSAWGSQGKLRVLAGREVGEDFHTEGMVRGRPPRATEAKRHAVFLEAVKSRRIFGSGATGSETDRVAEAMVGTVHEDSMSGLASSRTWVFLFAL